MALKTFDLACQIDLPEDLTHVDKVKFNSDLLDVTIHYKCYKLTTFVTGEVQYEVFDFGDETWNVLECEVPNCLVPVTITGDSLTIEGN